MTTKQTIIAANFKAFHTLQSTTDYLNSLQQFLDTQTVQSKIVIFPPQSAIAQEQQASMTIGAQNAYPIDEGAFTGEVGYTQLQAYGIDTLLIGHSERRALGEDSTLLKAKIDFFQAKGMQIVYCIGESLAVYEQGIQNFSTKTDFLDDQLRIVDRDYDNLIVAYEPIWAIGTGINATPQEIAKTHSYLQQQISCPLLYGGSVKVDNVKSIMAIEGVDGVLVGSASLEVNNFIQMIKYIEEL